MGVEAELSAMQLENGSKKNITEIAKPKIVQLYRSKNNVVILVWLIDFVLLMSSYEYSMHDKNEYRLIITEYTCSVL